MNRDRTWCAEPNCPVRQCSRNQANIGTPLGMTSWAELRGTELCMLGKGFNHCIDSCEHALQCFSEIKDADEAIRKLTDEYCENCAFASIEED